MIARLSVVLLLVAFCQTSVDLDDRTDWRTCVKPSCDPGGSGIPTFVEAIPVTNTTRDGHAIHFVLMGPKYTNALWYDYVGVTPNGISGLIDLWAYLPSQDSDAQAFEYDAFQYVGSTRYMFGTQCNQLGDGRWDVWDMLHGKWVASSVQCALSKDAWHHIQIAFHRYGSLQYYDAITIDGRVNAVNMTEPSGPLPKGWANNSGLNIQLDIGPAGGTISEYVDQANLLFFGF